MGKKTSTRSAKHAKKSAKKRAGVGQRTTAAKPAGRGSVKSAVKQATRPGGATGRRSAASGAASPAAPAAPRLLSGGNPQIAKGDGDTPVQAYIAAMPGWKRDVGRRIDAIIERTVPGVRKAVRWNSPFYGAPPRRDGSGAKPARGKNKGKAQAANGGTEDRAGAGKQEALRRTGSTEARASTGGMEDRARTAGCGDDWFLGLHCITKYVKVAFFNGTSLRPLPPVASKNAGTRYFHIYEGDDIDEAQFADWVRQASELPGEQCF